MKRFSTSLKIKKMQINSGAKGLREALMGCPGETVVVASHSEAASGRWDELLSLPSQDPPLPQEWVRALALAPSFLWEAWLPHCMQSGSWNRNLGIATDLGLKGDLWGVSPLSLYRTILSFSHHASPSEFSPRPRKSVLVSSLNSSYCSIGKGLLSGVLVPHSSTLISGLQVELSWALAWRSCS